VLVLILQVFRRSVLQIHLGQRHLEIKGDVSEYINLDCVHIFLYVIRVSEEAVKE